MWEIFFRIFVFFLEGLEVVGGFILGLVLFGSLGRISLGVRSRVEVGESGGKRL